MKVEEVVAMIRTAHREQRFAVKKQSMLDRSLEAYVRVNVFGFSSDMDEAEREAISKKTMKLLKLCRAGEAPEEYGRIAKMTRYSDRARLCFDELRKENEKLLVKLATHLPGYQFVQETAGAGDLGFAQIVGEAGDLSNYPNPAKLWKRLGLAPYDGLAMCSWMRETWRPRKLTSEEWIANPFKAERYAIIAQIAQWLWVKQWTGKEKAPPNGKPNGPYGEVYANRRARTAVTHPDWTAMHSHKDALRIMFKKFVLDLWVEWHRSVANLKSRHPVTDAALSSVLKYPEGECENPAPLSP